MLGVRIFWHPGPSASLGTGIKGHTLDMAGVERNKEEEEDKDVELRRVGKG